MLFGVEFMEVKGVYLTVILMRPCYKLYSIFLVNRDSVYIGYVEVEGFQPKGKCVTSIDIQDTVIIYSYLRRFLYYNYQQLQFLYNSLMGDLDYV